MHNVGSRPTPEDTAFLADCSDISDSKVEMGKPNCTLIKGGKRLPLDVGGLGSAGIPTATRCNKPVAGRRHDPTRIQEAEVNPPLQSPCLSKRPS